MVRNRKGIAPWSLAREAGIESATVDGTIEVPQYVQPVLDTGFVDEKGDWKGAKSNDKDFIAFGTFPGIANGGTILTPGVNPDGTWPLDMTGYTDLFIAVKPSNGGNFAIKAVMGPDSLPFANLRPVDAAAALRTSADTGGNFPSFYDVMNDAAEMMIVDVWNIYMLQNRASGQKLLQFQITNNTGDISDIETAFMRLV